MTLKYEILEVTISDEGLVCRVRYQLDFTRNGQPRQRIDTFRIALPRHSTVDEVKQSISNRLLSELNRYQAVLTATDLAPTIPLNQFFDVVIP